MKTMVEIKKFKSNNWEPLGEKEFVCLPRIDEYINLDVDKKSRWFKVVSVAHGLLPAADKVDLLAVESEEPKKSYK